MAGARSFLVYKMSRLAVGPTQPPMEWVLRTYLHLLLRLRMSGAVLLLPLYACRLWAGTALLFAFCTPCG